MKIGKSIVFAGVIGLLGVGLAPMTYAYEDGQFPVFPTVIGDASSSTDSVSSPQATTATATEKNTVVKTVKTVKQEEVKEETGVKSSYPTNEAGVFSPWAYVTGGLFGRANAQGEGVVLAVTPVNAKPSNRGDLQYQIFYANNTGETLRNVSVQVFLPKNFQYLDSDLRPDSKGNGTVVYDLGKIASGESGFIALEARSKKSKVKDAFVSATMSYEDIDGNAQVVNATASNAFNGKNGNGGLSASILDGAGGFMVWLFVITLLIAIAFAAYQYLVAQASARRAPNHITAVRQP